MDVQKRIKNLISRWCEKDEFIKIHGIDMWDDELSTMFEAFRKLKKLPEIMNETKIDRWSFFRFCNYHNVSPLKKISAKYCLTLDCFSAIMDKLIEEHLVFKNIGAGFHGFHEIDLNIGKMIGLTGPILDFDTSEGIRKFHGEIEKALGMKIKPLLAPDGESFADGYDIITDEPLPAFLKDVKRKKNLLFQTEHAPLWKPLELFSRKTYETFKSELDPYCFEDDEDDEED